MSEENETKDTPKEIEEIVEKVSQLNVLQLSTLVETLEETFGVSAMPTAVSAAPAAADGETEEEEKAIYNVVLKSDGGNKIAVIKALRQLKTDLGLKEAKEMVDNAPSPIEEEVPAERAKEMKSLIEEAGGEVDLE